VLFCIEPVTAAVLSVFWLKELMTGQQVFGGGLIVVAMVVASAVPYMLTGETGPDAAHAS